VIISQVPLVPLNKEIIVALKFINPVHQMMFITISKPSTSNIDNAEVISPSFPTFIAPKEHDEDEEDEKFKALKAKDDPLVIRERKINYVVINFPVKVVKASNTKFVLQIGVKYEASSGEQMFDFPISFNLGPITDWKGDKKSP